MSVSLPGYRVLGLRARGGFGEVYDALRGETRVIIKHARDDVPHARDRLARETRALQAVGTRAAPAVLDAGDGYLVLEAVTETQPLEPRVLAERLATALAAVHASGWIHGDLTPANILAGRELKLIDFGSAARIDGSDHDPEPRVGTPAYMAPEQCAGSVALTPATDVYAFGVIVFEMLTGAPPFHGSATEIYQAHLARRPDLSAVPERWRGLLAACLAKDAAARPADGAALVAAIGALSLQVSNAPRTVVAATQASTERAVLLAFQSSRSLVDVQRTLADCGGVLATSGTHGYVAVFPAAQVEQPIEQAQRVINALAAERAVIDAGSVTRRGSYTGAAIVNARKALANVVAGGVEITQAAHQLVPSTPPTALVGRDAELARVRSALTLPGIIAIEGGVGIGKSALVEACIAASPKRVVRVTANLSHVLAAVLDVVAGELRAQALARGVDPRGLAIALGDGTDAHLAPGAKRQLVATALATAIAAAGSIVLVADDAHVLDESIVDGLELATLGEHAAAATVLVAARPALFTARPRFGLRAVHHEHIVLGALTRSDASELVRRLLAPAERIPEQAIDRVVELTGARPDVIVELCRAFHAEGAVRKRPESDRYYFATDAIDRADARQVLAWSIERELAALPVELAAHARLCAVIGDPVDKDVVAGTIDALDRAGLGAQFPLDATVSLDRLEDAGVLARGRFRSDQQRDAIAATLPEALRRAVHDAAYAFLAAARPSDLRAIARHATGDAAARAYRQLAADATRRHAFLDAERWLTRELELPLEDAARLGALRHRGLARYRLGRYEDSAGDYAEAATLATQLRDTRALVDILLDHATALDWIYQFSESRALAEQAIALAVDPSPELEARMLMARARNAWRAGELQSAIELAERTLARAEQNLDASYETWIGTALIALWLMPLVGRIDDAATLYERVREVAAQRGDLYHLAAAHNNSFNLWQARGDFARLLADQERYRELARRLGAVNLEYNAAVNVAEAHYNLRQLDRARALLAEAYEFEDTLPAVFTRPQARVVALRVDAWDRAVDRIRATLAWLDAHAKRAEALIPEDVVFVEMARLAIAADAAGWDALLERARTIVEPSYIDELEQLRARLG